MARRRIDIDDDGQLTERSTLVYNIVTDRALIVMAAKLRRPELLDPVRRNLNALQYLLHADGEVVSEISRRQDQFTRGAVAGYWFPLTYMAVRYQDGQLSTLADRAASEGARLSALLEYPELSQPLPSQRPLPDDFEKVFDEIGIARIRRGPLSATLVPGGSSRFGTRGVPVAIELSFRDGGRLDGCRPIPDMPGTFVLEQDRGAYRAGRHKIRFGPGEAPHRYTQLRGAEPRLPGQSVYITGYTPFDRTILLECG